MRIIPIGHGQAGGKVVSRIVKYGNQDLYRNIVTNLDRADLSGIEGVHKLPIGTRYDERGVGANLELGAEKTLYSVNKIKDEVYKRNEKFRAEAILIVASMAGGLGAGGSPVLAKALKEEFNLPLYAVGILPSADELPPHREALYLSNALKSYDTWRKNFDNVILFDNQQYVPKVNGDSRTVKRSDDSLYQRYARINDDIAKRLAILFGAEEARNPSPEEVFGAAEILESLGHDGEVSTIGYHGEMIATNRFLGFGKKKTGQEEVNLSTIINGSMKEESLSYPSNIEGATSAALLFYGDPNHFNIEDRDIGLKTLEEKAKVANVRFGDYPINNSHELGALVLVSGVKDDHRIKQLEKQLESLSS